MELSPKNWTLALQISLSICTGLSISGQIFTGFCTQDLSLTEGSGCHSSHSSSMHTAFLNGKEIDSIMERIMHATCNHLYSQQQTRLCIPALEFVCRAEESRTRKDSKYCCAILPLLGRCLLQEIRQDLITGHSLALETSQICLLS